MEFDAFFPVCAFEFRIRGIRGYFKDFVIGVQILFLSVFCIVNPEEGVDISVEAEDTFGIQKDFAFLFRQFAVHGGQFAEKPQEILLDDRIVAEQFVEFKNILLI